MKAKVLSKIFKVAVAVGILTSAILKWVEVLPNATIADICVLWSVIYGLGAGTIDLNILVDKFTNKNNSI